MLEVSRFGADDGEPLLAVHGVTGRGGRWRELAERGLPERRWLAVDLRGHGRSTWDAPWTVETHVGDLLETLDAEGVERCDVVGHSFGGLLATHLAATAPSRVGRVALLDPAIAQDGHEMLEAAEETRLDEGWPTREEGLRERLEGRTAAAVPYAEADYDQAVEQGEDGRWRLPFCRSTVVAAWSEMAREPVPLGGFQGELLLVPALHDGMVGEHVVEWLRNDLDSRLTVHGLEAGHIVYWDAFDETAAVLRTFFELPSG
ncbi:MAG TPA: alpha/beta fold hydrolase [Gaiellales bacterium]|nr:alpha/beta fold hydrolase [Gaiellales bacterium]